MTPALAPAPRVRRCGPYLLGRRIGVGGMAAVFAARQEMPSGVGRLVAIKLMSAALSDDREFRSLFVREASIATRLAHPNLVRIYDVGEASGDLYIAMEFVHGPSLGALQAAAAGPMPPGIAARLIGDVARALQAAHELKDAITGEAIGLVHQDVSPQNVMVGYDGVAKLLDFGVARVGAVDASRTETLRGKPSYLAPEQLEGGRIDRRTDLFALGVILFELLSGERLFKRGSIAESHHAVLACKVPDIRALRPELPEPLARVVARALRREPSERFATAQELRRALLDACAEADIREADDADVAAYTAKLVPSQASPGDLEREIALSAGSGEAGQGDATSSVDVADLPTMAPKRASRVAPPAAPEAPAILAAEDPAPERPAHPAKRAFAIALLVLGLGAAALVATRSPAPAPLAPDARESAVALTPSALAPSSASTPSPVASSAHPAESPSAETPGPAHRVVATPHVSAAPLHSAAPIVSAIATASADATVLAIAPEPPKSGFLSVRSTPWGHVRIDGTPAGDSPLVHVPLKAGPHTVKIVTDDGRERSVPVVIEGEKESKVNLTL